MCWWVELSLRVRSEGVGMLAVSEIVRFLWWLTSIELIGMAKEGCKILRERRRVGGKIELSLGSEIM